MESIRSVLGRVETRAPGRCGAPPSPLPSNIHRPRFARDLPFLRQLLTVIFTAQDDENIPYEWFGREGKLKWSPPLIKANFLGIQMQSPDQDFRSYCSPKSHF